MRRIGLLLAGDHENDPEMQDYLQLFRQELQKSGWTEGSNIRFDVRSHRGDANRAGNVAAELVQLKPDILEQFRYRTHEWRAPYKTRLQSKDFESRLIYS